MKILLCGDIVGRSGRKSLLTHLPKVQSKFDPDFIIVNGENAAHGYGITQKICDELFSIGVNVITTGNHVWKQKEILGWIDQEPRLIRPMNYPIGTPGNGHGLYESRDGRRILVSQPMGRLFMEPLDDPFVAMDQLLSKYKLGRKNGSLDAIIVDFHAEATSEKVALGHYLDGRVSIVVGTHTHVPTSDGRVLPGGTVFQTDLGMCGDYNSVIGMKKQEAINRFLKRTPSKRLEPADGEGTLSGVLVELDDQSGLGQTIHTIQLGGCLPDKWPQ